MRRAECDSRGLDAGRTAAWENRLPHRWSGSKNRRFARRGVTHIPDLMCEDQWSSPGPRGKSSNPKDGDIYTKESMVPQKLKGQFRPKSDRHVLPLPCCAVYPPRTTWCAFHRILFNMMQRDGTLLAELKVAKNVFGENSRVSLLLRGSSNAEISGIL